MNLRTLLAALFGVAVGGHAVGDFFDGPGTPRAGGRVVAAVPLAPGGRLTTSSGNPIQGTVANATSLYFAPYPAGGPPTVPIFTGTGIQNFQFTSGPADNVGLTLPLGSNWSANSVFDAFVGLKNGFPVLCSIAWTNATTRATAVSQYGAMQTNSVSATCNTSNTTSITCQLNQCTYLGTILTDANNAGQITWSYGSETSGGGAGRLAIWNYYNRVTMTANAQDGGASYTYTSATVRQCRASAGMQVTYVVGFPLDTLSASLFDNLKTAAVSGANGGIGFGLDVTNAFSVVPVSSINDPSTFVFFADQVTKIAYGPGILGIGSHFIACLQQADGANALTFNNVGSNTLSVSLPM